MNNFIENVSRSDVGTGMHSDAGVNSMLIQIIEVGNTFPTPKYEFKEVLQFEFDDINEESPTS